ncbi:MAG: 30S ribosomal protein S9 [Candidatus Aenigmatarchaeota archaeon]
MKKSKIIIHAVGKRKRAIARATLREGSGRIRINKVPLELYRPKYAKLRIEEPLILAKDFVKNVDIDVNVKGGGVFGQVDAIRVAICNALVKFNKNLKKLFLSFDRSLLVSDPRRTEPHKPSRSSAGPRRKKQQSKR